MNHSTFVDRIDSGTQLAQRLRHYAKHPNALVIGLPRGGMVTAAQVAHELQLPLDMMVPRKIGAPFNEELAIGALTASGEIVWNDHLLNLFDITPSELAPIITKEKNEAIRRLNTYRQGRPLPQLANKIVIIVDDGIATGATMRAAIAQARAQKAQKIVVGTPVITPDVAAALQQEADQIVSIYQPETFTAISSFYRQFPQISDQEVIALFQS